MKKAQNHFDLIVVGLGAMGSATLYQAARAGLRVLGVDSYHPPHTYGSSHGDSRITRLAIGEGEEYVPLAKRSREIWQELEADYEEKLIYECGGLVLAPRGNQFLDTTERSAQKYGIPHHTLAEDEINREFPMFSPGPGIEGVYEPTAGYVLPEAIIELQLRGASKLGAQIMTDNPVQEWSTRGRQGQSGKSCQIRSEEGNFTADKMVIAAGPWVREIVPEGKQIFTIHEQMLYWFPIKENYEELRRSPVFIWEWEGDGMQQLYGFYGFPAIDGPEGGVKVATEQREHPADPFAVSRRATEQESQEMYRTYVAPHLPWLGEEPIRSESCLYTSTRNSRFLIDWHPDHDTVLILSPCSGHGFKHSAAIGEMATKMILGNDTELIVDAENFSWQRVSSGV